MRAPAIRSDLSAGTTLAKRLTRTPASASSSVLPRKTIPSPWQWMESLTLRSPQPRPSELRGLREEAGVPEDHPPAGRCLPWAWGGPSLRDSPGLPASARLPLAWRRPHPRSLLWGARWGEVTVYGSSVSPLPCSPPLAVPRSTPRGGPPSVRGHALLLPAAPPRPAWPLACRPRVRTPPGECSLLTNRKGQG